MNKYCFIHLDSPNRMPYLQKYLCKADYPYDLILWDRTGTKDTYGAENCYYMTTIFDKYRKSKQEKRGIINSIYKVFAYTNFFFYLNHHLKKNKYQGIFVLAQNTGILCIHTLIKYYRGRYILDIRDYFREKNKWIFYLDKKLMENSFANTISSEAYKVFLPKGDFIITHNSQDFEEDLVQRFRMRKKRKARPIILGCIGGIKFEQYDKKIINFFANDNRFLLKFIGRGYDVLKYYCEERHIDNVYIEGEFPMNKTMDKYESVDMILNMYGNKNPHLDYALSNKLYFSAQLGIPIVVCPDTYMEEVSKKYQLGISVDIEKPTSKDKLVDFYDNLDYKTMISGADLFLENVKRDEKIFFETVTQFTNVEDNVS